MAKYEKPAYVVVETLTDKIELRDYPATLRAETTVTGTRGEAANKAFQILAGYIFGDNRARGAIATTAPAGETRASEKIAMTAPVTQAAADRDGDGDAATRDWEVAFIMPAQYTRETLPEPNDPRIRIYETEPHRAAAIRFSGRWTSSRFSKEEARLREAVKAQGYKPVGPAQYAYYNGPFTPFFLRRNEVIARVERTA